MKNHLSERWDEIGAHVGILCISMLFFLLLWGVRLPAITAGLGMYGLLTALRHAGRQNRLKQKENNLRRRIGGEMALERLLLQSPEKTHFEAALHLSAHLDLEMCRILDDGILCKKGGETLLVHYLQRHPGDTVDAGHIAALQRICRQAGAGRLLLCTPAALSPAAREQLHFSPPVTWYDRDKLIALFGSAAPATDSQLVMLSRRKKQSINGSRWWRRILQPRHARSYAQYAGLMMTLRFLTGQASYAYPAIGLMALAAACNCLQRTKKRSP